MGEIFPDGSNLPISLKAPRYYLPVTKEAFSSLKNLTDCLLTTDMHSKSVTGKKGGPGGRKAVFAI